MQSLGCCLRIVCLCAYEPYASEPVGRVSINDVAEKSIVSIRFYGGSWRMFVEYKIFRVDRESSRSIWVFCGRVSRALIAHILIGVDDHKGSQGDF